MLLSFEMSKVGVLVLVIAGTSLPSRDGEGTSVLPESKNIANEQCDSPGTLEVLSSPRRIGRRGCRTRKRLVRGFGSWTRGSEDTMQPWYSAGSAFTF